MSLCSICPRKCQADREGGQPGFCGAGNEMRIARAAMHYWEEPCISGAHDSESGRGSGAVFFCGCPLGCVFCQNHDISGFSRIIEGKAVTPYQLAEIMLRLEDKGAYNINLVSPTQYTPQIREALETVKHKIGIPVIWNTGGYELTTTVDTLKGLVDVWLPDLKYYSSELSRKYSRAPEYFRYASDAVRRMFELSGPIVFGDDEMVKSGLIIRHMVMPSQRKDSMAIIKWIADSFSSDNIRVSIMSQYTPTGINGGYPELDRRVTSFEYKSVTALASELGLKGWAQDRTSVGSSFVPSFDYTGIY